MLLCSTRDKMKSRLTWQHQLERNTGFKNLFIHTFKRIKRSDAEAEQWQKKRLNDRQRSVSTSTSLSLSLSGNAASPLRSRKTHAERVATIAKVSRSPFSTLASIGKHTAFQDVHKRVHYEQRRRCYAISSSCGKRTRYLL